MLQGGRDLLARFGESFRNRVGEKLILTPKVFVKPANSETRRLHNACDAGTAQPLSAELASGIPHNTIAGLALVLRIVTHITLLDHIYNLQTQNVSIRGEPSSRQALCPIFRWAAAVPGRRQPEAISSSKERYCADCKRGARLG